MYPVGLLKKGTVIGYDPSKGTLKVKLETVSSVQQTGFVDIQAPFPINAPNGLFIGTQPPIGTLVVVGQSYSNKYYFVSFLTENLSQIPLKSIKEDELLIAASSKTKITLNKSTSDIYIGSDKSRMHINTSTNLFTTFFQDEHHFTESSRQINGLIKRDKVLKQEAADLNDRLSNDDYDNNYAVIGLDPTISTNIYNPPLVENREIVYEFKYSSDIKSDLEQAKTYLDGSSSDDYLLYNRRESKADTLSLSLSYPNYLIETVKGTSVDIFGNVLDLNRFPLLFGGDQVTLNESKTNSKSDSFLKLRELHRKGIAYHFEINARKDFGNQQSTADASQLFGFDAKFPDADYGRLRSRFFIDVDKEGQFKINIPASSDKGNIPLLTRYENYSNLSDEDNNNPNKIISSPDGLIDILQDSFACPKLDLETLVYEDEPGSIVIKNENGEEATPKDRRYGNIHIKHGTAYHDILATCYAHQKKDFLDYQYFVETTPIDIDGIPLLKDIVSDTIKISGPDAKAGGRSGIINFDGSIELNVGANHIDRQSLWLDFAGGIVGNIGRDRNLRSAALSMNGDVFIQVGGLGVVGDSRFEKDNNGQIGAVLDLRVFNDGLHVTMIRVDKDGVSIATPGDFKISARSIKFTSSSFEIDSDQCMIMGRPVQKDLGPSM